MAALIASAAKNLKGKVKRVGEQITKFFSKLRHELSFSVTRASKRAVGLIGFAFAYAGYNQ